MSLVLNVEILGEYRNLTAATKGAQTALQGLQSSAGNIGRKINSAFATIGVGFGLYQVVEVMKDSVKAASDMEQQFGAVQSIFKDLAPEMQEFATTTSKLGLSTADAARSSALLGTLLKGSGMPMKQVASETKKLTLLAADLAATFGGTTADAVKALSSTFKGEFDPIEKFGVSIKKSDINARLAADGMKGLTGQALKQAEAQAALNLIYEKTVDAQGQAARESDTFAGKTAELQAKFTDLQANIATSLLPTFVEVAQFFVDVIPHVQNFFKELLDPTTAIGEAWAGVTKAFGLFGETFSSVMNSGRTDAETFIGVLKNLENILITVSSLIAGFETTGYAFGKLFDGNPGEFFKVMNMDTIDAQKYINKGKSGGTTINIQGSQSAQQIKTILQKSAKSTGTRLVDY